MFSKIRPQYGFTLIEVIIVLAITMAMAPIVFKGQSTARRNAQLTDAMDRTKNYLQAAKNEANTTVNTRSTGGTDSANAVYGNLVSFSGSTMTVTQYTIPSDIANPGSVTLTQRTSYSKQIPWGMSFVSAGSTGTSIFYIRSLHNGEIQTFVSGGACPNILNPVNHLGVICQNDGAESVYIFSDGQGMYGRLYVDGKNGGAVRWEI